jgi:hypothetical protein
MQIIEPIDPKDCINLINLHKDEIKSKKYNIKIKEEWVNGFDDSILFFLVENCEHSQGQIANATTSLKILEAVALLAPTSALRNPNVTSEIITTLFESGYDRNDIAHNPKTPIHILRILSKDKETSTKASVAYNSSTPPDILTDLANDDHKWVRKNVGGNLNTPPQILALLAREVHWWEIRQAVAANPHTPTEILGYLSENSSGNYDSYHSQGIRKNVANNPNAPMHFRKNLSSNKKGSCFIATAAYGSSLATEVIILSHFRDKVLLNSVLGRIFVRSYYFISPPIALVIEKTEFLKTITRNVLIVPILRLLKTTKFDS